MPTPQFWAPFQEQSCQTVTEREFTRTAHLIIPILYYSSQLLFLPRRERNWGRFPLDFFCLLIKKVSRASERASESGGSAISQKMPSHHKDIIAGSTLWDRILSRPQNLGTVTLPSCPHSTTEICYEMLSVFGEPLPVQESHEEGPSLPYCAGNANTAARSLAVSLISCVARSPARHFFAC